MNVRYTNNFISSLMQQQRCYATYISTSLYGNPRRRRSHSESFDSFIDDEQQAPSSSFAPASRPSKVDRFPGHDSVNRMARMHRISVHDPRHRLFIRIHVGRWNIFFWSDEIK